MKKTLLSSVLFVVLVFVSGCEKSVINNNGILDENTTVENGKVNIEFSIENFLQQVKQKDFENEVINNYVEPNTGIKGDLYILKGIEEQQILVTDKEPYFNTKEAQLLGFGSTRAVVDTDEYGEPIWSTQTVVCDGDKSNCLNLFGLIIVW